MLAARSKKNVKSFVSFRVAVTSILLLFSLYIFLFPTSLFSSLFATLSSSPYYQQISREKKDIELKRMKLEIADLKSMLAQGANTRTISNDSKANIAPLPERTPNVMLGRACMISLSFCVSYQDPIHHYPKALLIKSHISPLPSTNVAGNQYIAQATHTIPEMQGDGSPGIMLTPISSGFDNACRQQYGLELVDNWRKNKETWCESSADDMTHEYKPRLACYPMHQAHKITNHMGKDMFCEGTDIFIDFSAVGKNLRGNGAYLDFQDGSIFSSCAKTAQFKDQLFMPHHKKQMLTFKQNAAVPPRGSYDIAENITYLMPRDEDYENMFHSAADFVRGIYRHIYYHDSTTHLAILTSPPVCFPCR